MSSFFSHIGKEILLADRGYDTNDIVSYAISAGMEPVIPSKKNRKEQRDYYLDGDGGGGKVLLHPQGHGLVKVMPWCSASSAMGASKIRRRIPSWVASAINVDGIIYDITVSRGRRLIVFEDKVIIKTSVTLGSILTGNFSDGEKTIYYADCIGIQFKESGMQLGYLQLETASALMNNRASNFFNENSFTFEGSVLNSQMKEIADYIRIKVEECKKQKSGQTAAVSAADELKKFKELLDSGVITQEEFDAKKKQLLGL